MVGGGGGWAWQQLRNVIKGLAFWDVSYVPSLLGIPNPQAQSFSATATLLLSCVVLWPLFTDTTCPTLARMRWKPAARLTDEKQPTQNHSGLERARVQIDTRR